MDWNWFFSSLAQSGAALIGIIGAFLISRVLSEKDLSNRILYEFRDIAFKRTNVLNDIDNIPFVWYNRNTILQSQEFWDKLLQLESDSGDDPETIATECLSGVYGLYDSPDNLNFATRLVLRNKSIDEYEYSGCYSPICSVSSDQIDNIHKNIENLRHECKVLIRKYGLIKNDISGSIKRLRTVNGIVILLLFGSLTSVCIPIMMLPMEISELGLFEAFSYNSLWARGSFVGALFIIIVILCVILMASLRKVQKNYMRILRKISDKHLKLSGYCKYFD
ncbi:MAG: hypothetical protein PHU99_08035 [Candidatus Cloacimonetes bacterium]|jgi:hypothetical protein|nr:hypothetical protein [Candidatus Cloacimonadota bacterium]MDY0337188.1 hypothetical protein [Candidatus Cloacimonadaceae bacterium]MCB5269227.1 hypothetical protein [Candidatus Cloacimonadota bacterium]MCK9333707.1 hypothetical protein [Candidatus Cloacimonadota bacterium]MDD2543576.1 hypothetical protein [Candidatus Cloacimonadota bacterium]